MSEHPQQPSPYLRPPPPGGAPGGDGAPYAPAPPVGPYAVGPVGIDGPWGPLADWGSRVGASLVDVLVNLVAIVPIIIGGVMLGLSAPSPEYDPATGTYADATTNGGLLGAGIAIMVAGYLLLIGISLWNRTFKQGRTGQSIGKKVVGIKLVAERTGEPIGAGMSFVRELCHALDGMAYIGYLWPLWDPKRQTFADKVIGTVVVRVPKA